jgi:hypothetical protein
VAGATHRRFASSFEGLESTDLVTAVIMLAVGGLDQFLEQVLEASVAG